MRVLILFLVLAFASPASATTTRPMTTSEKSLARRLIKQTKKTPIYRVRVSQFDRYVPSPKFPGDLREYVTSYGKLAKYKNSWIAIVKTYQYRRNLVFLWGLDITNSKVMFWIFRQSKSRLAKEEIKLLLRIIKTSPIMKSKVKIMRGLTIRIQMIPTHKFKKTHPFAGRRVIRLSIERCVRLPPQVQKALKRSKVCVKYFGKKRVYLDFHKRKLIFKSL